MIVKSGQTVVLRDGRTVLVTDAADQDPDAYRWYGSNAQDEVVVKAEMPVETIFVGILMDTRPRGWNKEEPKFVVSDMSEVVSIVE